MSPRTSERASRRSRRYWPRKGTIRGSAPAPAARARRSAQSPAQKIALRAATAAPLDGRDLAAQQQPPAALGHLAGELARDAGEVDDAGRRRVQRGDAAAVR